MGPGVDPHLYKPAASDVGKLQKAQVIFYSGLHLEGQMAQLLERLSKSGRSVHAVTSGIPERQLLRPAEFEGQFDPHVWGDASLWASCIPIVVEALSAIDPAGEAHISPNAPSSTVQNCSDSTSGRSARAWSSRRSVASSSPVTMPSTISDAPTVSRSSACRASRRSRKRVSRISPRRSISSSKRKVKAIFVESSVPRAAIERISNDSGREESAASFSPMRWEHPARKYGGGETYDEGTYVGHAQTQHQHDGRSA